METGHEKLIYLSLGILALVGIVLTFILISRARELDRQAARIERPEETLPLLLPVEDFEEATAPAEVDSNLESGLEATPSGSEASPSAGF